MDATQTQPQTQPTVAAPPVIAPTTSRSQTVIIIVAIVVAFLLGVGTVVGVGFASGKWSLFANQTKKVDGNSLTTVSETTIASVAEKASPSVVSILTTTDVKGYFTTTEQDAAGTGFVVGADGVILTNKHVVDGAKKLTVITADGTEYASVDTLLVDPLNDLAYLRVKGVNNWPTLELGDSSTVKIGQGVVAIGNSLGEYQNTVTSGIISGLNRPLVAQSETGASESLSDLLQTDAAINPGNSGGPLLNASGQVIGINTAIAADAQGIGFSIPINATKGVLKQVLAGNSSPKRAYLGVRYIVLNAAVAKQHNTSTKQGALVSADDSGSAVVSGSPADKAGIKDGDIITKINGVEVGPHGGVSSLISQYAPGDSIKIELLRGSETKTVTVDLAAYSN